MENDIIFNDEKKEIIRGYNANISDLLECVNAANIIESAGYKKIESEFANFISCAVENKLNEKFHNSLNVLEKNGILSVEKMMAHEKKVAILKGVTAGATIFAFEIAPLVYDVLRARMAQNNIKEFLIGWHSYISGDFSIENMSLINDLVRKMNIKISPEEYYQIFEKYANATQREISMLSLSGNARDRITDDDMSIVAKKVVSLCDLSDKKIQEKSLEFLEDSLCIKYSDASEILRNCEAKQEINSEMITFSSVSYVTYFEKVIGSLQTAKQYAYYDSDSDPYKKERDERNQIITNAINLDKLDTIKSLSPNLAKLYVSVGLMKKSLNPNCEPKKVIQIQKIKNDMKKELIDE